MAHSQGRETGKKSQQLGSEAAGEAPISSSPLACPWTVLGLALASLTLNCSEHREQELYWCHTEVVRIKGGEGCPQGFTEHLGASWEADEFSKSFMSGEPGVFVLIILKVIGANLLGIVVQQLERSVAFIIAYLLRFFPSHAQEPYSRNQPLC